MLDADELALFRRLGVFCGGFAIGMAQQVGGTMDSSAGSSAGSFVDNFAGISAGADPWSLLDRLGSLVDKSLVVVDATELPRYRLLDSTRLHALELPRASADEWQHSKANHAAAVLGTLATTHQQRADGLLTFDQAIGLVRLELDNLRAAVD